MNDLSNHHSESPDHSPPIGKAANRASGSLESAAQGWSSILTLGISLGFLIEALTGLWIYLGPFSVSLQIQVVIHTVVGFLLLVPYGIYQIKHLLLWKEQPLSVVKFLGYLSMLLILVCLYSGILVTWQALFETKLTAFWDRTHLITGIGCAALALVHVFSAYLRRRGRLHGIDGFPAKWRRFLYGNIGGVALVVTIAIIAGSFWPTKTVYIPIPDDYSLPEYAGQYEEYQGNPFAPTYARTANGELINPDILANSVSCGTSGCHEEILAEWQPSAHRFSAINPPFQQVQKNFAQDRSPADTRYCAGCHDPISLFAGAKDIHNLNLSAPGMQEGNSCVVCHSISHVDQRGNADYILTPPTKYIWESTEGIQKFISDFLIRSYPRQHLADYDRTILRTPEFCGACHKQFIPEALNRFGLSPSQNQYDEWRKSHWVNETEPNKHLSCRDCHMRLVEDSSDPGAGEGGDYRRSENDGTHRHHGTVATNLFMPAVLKLPNWEKHCRLTQEWIQGKTIIPEIQDVWPEGPVAPIKLQAKPQARPGEEIDITAVIRNNKAGHNFITGPLDFLRVWVHLTISDANGHVLAEWGAIDPESRKILDSHGQVHTPGQSREEGTLVLEGVPMDGEGNPIVKHELWKKAGGTGQRVLFPKYADKHSYHFQIPENATGPLTVSADLNFRRYRQEFLDLVVPEMEKESGVYQPTVTKDSASLQIEVIDDED